MSRGRRWCLGGVLVLGGLGGGAPAVEAQTYSWYGVNGRTCWANGWSHTETCQAVGNRFLDQRDASGNLRNVREVTVGNLGRIGPSGNYCGHVQLTSPPSQADGTDVSASTGWLPSSPLADFQLGNAAHTNVCQAHGTRWGRLLVGSANGASCTAAGTNPCGLQNYVSFASQGTNQRPWSRLDGQYPSLNISVTETAKTVSWNSGGGAWGYVCPIFKDASGPADAGARYVEYCMEKWKAGSGYPSFTDSGANATKRYDREVQCNSADGHHLDQIITKFTPGTAWYATKRVSSSNSFQWTSTNPGGSRRYWATISRPDLHAALRRINDNPDSNGDGRADYLGGCGRGVSTNPDDWALVGVENGLEGGFLNRAGANSTLELYTSFDVLIHGEWMSLGQRITSLSGRYAAVMQNDGNFVVYDNGVPIWNTPTYGAPNTALTLQTDGNLVMYSNGTAIWWTDTYSNGQKSVLVMQDDGNLVLYTAGVARWSSKNGRL